jgi:curli biogenesis system outer membrane secretion channel CsgG
VAEFTALTPELKAEGHQATVREMAISRLANSAVFVVVERESVDKLLREQAFQLTGATQQRDAVRLGNLLNAHAFLTGTLAESAMEPMGALPAGPEVDERYRGYGHTWKTEVFALKKSAVHF